MSSLTGRFAPQSDVLSDVFLPNVFRVLAHAPAVLASYMQSSVALGKTSFSALKKESIFLATSQANGCDYCLAAHTLFASKAGYNRGS
jgi:AhpD family alkylhydroperoxidase